MRSRWWQRTVAAIGSVERLLVELITNSTDSYKRLHPSGTTQVGIIEISYFPSEKGFEIQVMDQAEGISLERFRKALQYGEDTSGLSQGLPVRGTLGIGLKDVCIAMQGSRILSIHNGLLNECTIYKKGGKPWVKFLRINEVVTEKERIDLNLKGNGTIVTGFIPKEFLLISDFKTLHKNLCRHYMLRKINQSSRYHIILKKGKDEEAAITYAPLEGEKLLVIREENAIKIIPVPKLSKLAGVDEEVFRGRKPSEEIEAMRKEWTKEFEKRVQQA